MDMQVIRMLYKLIKKALFLARNLFVMRLICTGIVGNNVEFEVEFWEVLLIVCRETEKTIRTLKET